MNKPNFSLSYTEEEKMLIEQFLNQKWALIKDAYPEIARGFTLPIKHPDASNIMKVLQSKAVAGIGDEVLFKDKGSDLFKNLSVEKSLEIIEGRLKFEIAARNMATFLDQQGH